MVTVTTSWSGSPHAESRLLHAEMSAALRSAAQVQSVVIDHRTGVVDVNVCLPDGLTDAERDARRAAVQATLDVVVAEAFGNDGLVLGPVGVTERTRQTPSRDADKEVY
jgi:hypothetical protein